MTKARLAGIFYLFTFVTGMAGLLAGTGLLVANSIATICYVGVTVLFYELFKPVNRAISLTAGLFSAAGCILNFLALFYRLPINPLAFFGVYCVLIGFLIFESRFMPRALGIVLAIGGLSWLTFASSALAHRLSPYNYGPGILAEGALTVWLLAFG